MRKQLTLHHLLTYTRGVAGVAHFITGRAELMKSRQLHVYLFPWCISCFIQKLFIFPAAGVLPYDERKTFTLHHHSVDYIFYGSLGQIECSRQHG